jgi:histidine triad (HIT) family protein
METMPALTTNVEWGRWEDSGKLVLGSPADAEKNRYLEHYAYRLGVPVMATLEGAVAATLDMLLKLNNPHCVFCRIVTKDERRQIEWRGRDSVVITPLGPVVPGHRLVIPRIHVSDAFASPAIAGRTVDDASSYAQAMELGDCNVITSVGPNATQTVFHLHVHLVPREVDDGLTLPWTGQVRARA